MIRSSRCPARVVAGGVPLLAAILWVAVPPGSDGTLSAATVLRLQTDTIEVPSNELESVSLGFAGALESGSGEALARFLGSDGIHLQLEETAHAGLSIRQAVAALRTFLRGYDGGDAVVTRAAPVEGSQDRGFAEVLWTARASGTSDEIQRTLFLGLHMTGDDWRVDEVRFLR